MRDECTRCNHASHQMTSLSVTKKKWSQNYLSGLQPKNIFMSTFYYYLFFICYFLTYFVLIKNAIKYVLTIYLQNVESPKSV